MVGANRKAKRRPNTPACIEISLRSTIGPTTRKTSRDVSENWDSEAATKASASEQSESSTASNASARTDNHALSARVCNHRSGTSTLMLAAAIAPSTRKPPACVTS